MIILQVRPLKSGGMAWYLSLMFEASSCLYEAQQMPRRRRYCPAGYPVHVIQRGINRQICFTSEADMAAYVHWLAEGVERFEMKDLKFISMVGFL